VVEDEKRMRDLVKMYLAKEGFEVDEAGDGNDALTKIESNYYDLIILDLMLPGTDGLSICREVRREKNIPIIMLTAKGDELDRVLGLEMGADDYVVKPFSPRELVARVKSLLRRVNKAAESPVNKELRVGELLIKLGSRKLYVNEHEVALTPKEFDLLVFLVTNYGQVLTREQILEKVWGYDYFGDFRTVDTHIKNLREKIRHWSSEKYIHTVWGVGYRFEGG